MNPDKLQNVQQKLEAFLAQEKEQKERAQRCFVSYLRSIYLMKNKEVFDVFKLQLQAYAVSLGLGVAPRVRFLNKAQAQRVGSDGQRGEEQQSEEEEELRSFKAQLKGDAPVEGGESSESEDSEEDNDSGDEEEILDDESRTRLPDADESEEEDDLRDFDLLKVKIKDVFNVTGDQETEEEPATCSKKITAKETKFKEAKKILKRNFQVNTKVAFSEEGKAVQLWPPVQQAVTAEKEEEEDQVSGISVQKARERLQREDQFDKQLYSSKIKAKHRELRLKAKAARREASKQHGQKDEEDEVVAYLANHSEDEFDPDTLPDPDKASSSEEEVQMGSAKRKQSSDEEEEEEEKLKSQKKLRLQEDKEHEVLDTGLSLAEDEELVLHLLGGRR